MQAAHPSQPAGFFAKIAGSRCKRGVRGHDCDDHLAAVRPADAKKHCFRFVTVSTIRLRRRQSSVATLRQQSDSVRNLAESIHFRPK